MFPTFIKICETDILYAVIFTLQCADSRNKTSNRAAAFTKFEKRNKCKVYVES